MYFKFSREVRHRLLVEGYGELDYWYVYKIEQDQGFTGLFYYHRKICFFEFEGKEYGIMPYRETFMAAKAVIVDRKTDNVVGRIKLLLGYDRIGEIQFRDITYSGMELEPDVEAVFFKPGTWGYKKYGISGEEGYVTYSFRYTPTLSFIERLTEGSITLSGDNLLLLFAGIFLLHEQLEKQRD